MSYSIEIVESDRFALQLKGEPDFIRSLDMAPERIEPELLENKWLVLVFAVWSSPAIHAVQTAIDYAKECKGAFRLGIRPFEVQQEFTSWSPLVPTAPPLQMKVESGNASHSSTLHISANSSGLIWLVFDEGRLVAYANGPLSISQLSSLVFNSGQA